MMAYSLAAQRAITKDSTWVTNSAGAFFENHEVLYSNGESTRTTTLLGDTAQVVSKYIDDLSRRTDAMANDVQITSDFARQVKEIVRQDAPIATLLGISPLKRMLAPVDTALVDSTYRIRIGNATKNFKFSLTAQGVLRYKVDTFPTRTANYLGRVIRLNNWLESGDALDLYQFSNNRWYNQIRSVQLFLQSVGPQNRSAEPDIAGLREPLPVPILYDGGLALISGAWYRYDAKKKTWVKAASPTKPQPAKL